MLENLVKPASIIIKLQSQERDEALAELTECLISQNPALERDLVFDALVSREEKMSTLITPFFAVPHAIVPAAEKVTIAIGVSAGGVEFDVSPEPSQAGTVAKVIFCIIFNENNPDEHLYILKDIVDLVKTEGFLDKIMLCKTESELCECIKAESER